MSYIPLKEIPKESLPIYFCNVVVRITEKKRNKVYKYTKEFKKVVLKGCDEVELTKAFKRRKGKYILEKREINRCKIEKIEIKIIKFLSFGIFEIFE